MVSPAFSAAILEALTPGRPGHALWHGLDVQPQDLCAPKNRYSAFFPGACAIPERLREKGVDTVLIAGTLTNVCCEASARDAMMAGFKTVMVSDANAARSDAEHLAALVTLVQFFADVRSTDEVLGMLSARGARGCVFCMGRTTPSCAVPRRGDGSQAQLTCNRAWRFSTWVWWMARARAPAKFSK